MEINEALIMVKKLSFDLLYAILALLVSIDSIIRILDFNLLPTSKVVTLISSAKFQYSFNLLPQKTTNNFDNWWANM